MSTESADLYTLMQAAHATDRHARFGDLALFVYTKGCEQLLLRRKRAD